MYIYTLRCTVVHSSEPQNVFFLYIVKQTHTLTEKHSWAHTVKHTLPFIRTHRHPLQSWCGQPVQDVCRTGVEELEVIREKYACLPVMSVIGSSTSKSSPVRMIRIKPAPIWKP